MSNHDQDPAEDGQSAADSASLLEVWDQEAAAPAVTDEIETAAPAKKPRARAKKAAEPTPAVESDSMVAVQAETVDANEPAADASASSDSVESVDVAAVEPAPAKKSRKKATPATDQVVETAPRSMVEMVAERSVEPELEPEVEEEVEAGPAEDARSPFERLGLSSDLLKSITAVGYEEPTPIQQMVIPVLLAGTDLIAQAQTGSGKTAAFGLPIIEAIDPRDRHVQALILAPTRELAIQVAEALHKYGRHKEVETLPIYGGQPYERQFRGLQRGPQIVVGTPGRVMDHMRRETLNLEHTRFFVLDEADEMLDMGFVEDIEWILQHVPENRQTALFSATMPPRIAQLAATHLRNPERLTVQGKEMTVPETHQVFYEVPRARKIDALTRILDAETPPIAMIFARTKMGVDELGEALLARGYQAETLHGDLSQAQRDRVMRRFRTGQADILIATDVAARGIDVANVTHVINFDIPESAEAYVHRIGRTGRAGKKGIAITLVTPRETRWLKQIERIVRAKIEGRRLPTAADVAERRLEVLKQQIISVMQDESAYAYYNAVVDDLAEDHDATQVAAAVLKLYAEETGRGVPAEPAADDIALVAQYAPRQERFEQRGPRDDRGPRDERGPRDDSGNVRLFINVGRNLGVRPQDIVGAIANEAGIPGRAIGAIDIFEGYSFVDVPAAMAERVIDALVRSGIKGRSVNAEIARPGDGPRPVDRGPRRDFNDRPPRREGGYAGGGGGGYDRPPRRDGGYGGGGNYRGNAPAGPAPARWQDSPPRQDAPPRQYERPERGNERFDRGPGPRRDY